LSQLDKDYSTRPLSLAFYWLSARYHFARVAAVNGKIFCIQGHHEAIRHVFGHAPLGFARQIRGRQKPGDVRDFPSRPSRIDVVFAAASGYAVPPRMLNKCVILLIGCAALLVSSGICNAEVVGRIFFYDPNATTNYWQPIDFDGDGTNDFVFEQGMTWCVEEWSQGPYCLGDLDLSGNTNNQVIALRGGAVPLHAGATVSASPLDGSWTNIFNINTLTTNGGPGTIVGPGGSIFSNHIAGPTISTSDSVSGTLSGAGAPAAGDCIGVRLLISGEWHYGWIRFASIPAMQIPGARVLHPAVVEAAYETIPDRAIVVSPQPGPLVSAAKTGVEIELSYVQQGTSYATISEVTNSTPTNTTTIKTVRSKSTETRIDSRFVLALLANSFNTTFPSGARLAITGNGNFSFMVTDKSGSNVLLDASSVQAIADHASVNSGTETFVTKMANTTTAFSGTDTETFTEFATLSYDDTGIATQDGTRTQFQLAGILKQRRAINVGTGASTASITFRCSGFGAIRGGNQVLIEGAISGSTGMLATR
jgi:hypothetical protein